MPSEILHLPERGGWVALGLAALCWQDAEERGARQVQSLPGCMPVFVLGGT